MVRGKGYIKCTPEVLKDRELCPLIFNAIDVYLLKYDEFRNFILIYGESYFFDTMNEGESIPQYEFILTYDENSKPQLKTIERVKRNTQS